MRRSWRKRKGEEIVEEKGEEEEGEGKSWGEPKGQWRRVRGGAGVRKRCEEKG